MARPLLDDTPQYGPQGPPLNAKQGAARVGLWVPHFWKKVADGTFREPVYPAPRSPRWFGPELDADLEKTRMMPWRAKMARTKRARERRAALTSEVTLDTGRR